MSKTPFKKIRLSHHDYIGVGAYFVTLRAHERKCIFGGISGGEVVLNDIGQIVNREWLRSAEIREEIVLDAYVVMPNHLHGIVIFPDKNNGERGAGCRPALQGRSSREHETRSLSTFIGQFKAVTTTAIRRLAQQPDLRVWQTRFFDRVVRNETEMNRTREYIFNNPAQWELDEENPSAMPGSVAPDGSPLL
jgi:REP element-mobilizing transposase RayT